jgi:hypothetical protein
MTETLMNRVEPREAEIVRQFVQTQPVKVGALATALGLKVVKSPSLKPTISGLIRPSAESDAGFEILVNKFEPPERQRFTVAHEIAHYLLHRKEIGAGVIDSIMYRSSLSSRKEVEANRLAASIVMPVEAVSDELRRLGGADEPGVVEELAEQFRVSIPAMRIRLGIA